MRIGLIVALLVFSAAVQADSTLRIGSQVLTVGDSAVRVTELLGKPSYKSRSGSSHSSSRRGSKKHAKATTDSTTGEHWQYRRDGHATTVTIVDGRVTDIDDHRL